MALSMYRIPATGEDTVVPVLNMANEMFDCLVTLIERSVLLGRGCSAICCVATR